MKNIFYFFLLKSYKQQKVNKMIDTSICFMILIHGVATGYLNIFCHFYEKAERKPIFVCYKTC